MANRLEFRRQHVGRALARAFWLFEEEVNEGIRAAGFADFRQSDAQVIRCLGVNGSSIVELSERAKMTKQGMSKLVASLEERGYLESRPDPSDGRAKVITLTARGQELLKAGGRAIAKLEAKWAGVIGADALAAVKRALLDIADTLGEPDYL